MAGGFFQWLAHRLSSETTTLSDAQKTLTVTPVVTLTIGSTSLDAYVWGYKYEEKAHEPGSLTIWLDNRGDEFDDLTNDYPDITRGAAIDLRRGMAVGGVDTTEKLPRTWIEGYAYRYIDGAALFEIQCIDWLERLAKFRYASEASWSAADVSTIASSVLGQVNLTLAAGSFGFSTDFVISPRRNADQALNDLLRRVDEYLYTGVDGEIQHKELDPSEVASYTYDWSAGGGSNHPLMRGSEVAATSPRYTKVVVNGGPDLEYTGSAQDSDEITLVGTRLRTITDRDLSSNAQCAERARAELRFWLAQTITGTIYSRPHFTLRMFDVVQLSAPAWGGPTVTGRVRRIIEEYGRGRSLWQQQVDIGGLADRRIQSSDLSDGAVTSYQLDEGAVGTLEITEGAVVESTIADGSIATAKIADLAVETGKIAAAAVDGTKIEADAVQASHIDANAVTADAILAGAVGADELAANAVTAVKIAAGAVEAGKIAANAVTAAEINVSTLSAIAADMGTLTAGIIKMGTGTKDSNLTGFQIDSSELVGQSSGVDQVVLSSSDGKITAGAGAVVLDVNGMHATSGTADVNKHKIMDGSDVIMAMYCEIDEGVSASGILETQGKDSGDPEGVMELVAKTYNGVAQSGVATVSITMDTGNGVMDLSATYVRLGTSYFEGTEQAADPAAPGADRGRLYFRDNGSGKTQLCVRFNTGAVQVLATEP
jgi:hypothetical protein